MKTSPILPARLGIDADGVPTSIEHGDIYHPRAGAFLQARHVFLGGNGLPGRWQDRERFVVLETGFGLGNNFLATWAAWRDDPRRCERLVFISVERHPLSAEDLARVQAASPEPTLAAALRGAWPPLTPNLHRLVFEGGRVQLLLALGDAATWLPELQAEVDAAYLDGFAPDRNPAMWQPRVYKGIARLAAPGATVGTWTAARAVREGLASAGFRVHGASGAGGKRDITLAQYDPSFVPRRAPARRAVAATGVEDRHAIVIGAGLAGCAMVAALAEQGWRSTLIDRRPEPAEEASGNPAGVFHGVVHAQDGPHARFNRACALEAERAIARLLAAAPTPWGDVGGVLRLETALPDVAAMQALLASVGLPPSHVQALDALAASRLAGLPLAAPAWHYPGGGWVRPACLARAWRQAAGGRCHHRGGVAIGRLRRVDGAWQVHDVEGKMIATAPTVVLANANGAPELLRSAGAAAGVCPTGPVRGQLSVLPASARGSLPAPRCPVVGSGYLLPEIDGSLVFGATSQPGDPEPGLRAADHRHNLDRLAALSPALSAAEGLAADLPIGRTAWRCVSRDRLPLIGAVPATWLDGNDGGWDQPRFVPRVPGLYVLTALGSRGITVAPLAAQVLAAMITGAPVPQEASLLDAIDPARFVTRATRRLASAAAARAADA